MPRYFFDIHNAGDFTPDKYGIDLDDDEEARSQAISLLPEMAREELPDGDQHEFAVKARNEEGTVVYEASLTLNGRWRPDQQ